MRRRWFHQAQLVKPKPVPKLQAHKDYISKKSPKPLIEDPKLAKRNPLGVQLISRTLHGQIFPSSSSSLPPPSYVQISRDHLSTHGLDPTLASSLQSTSFTLPTLQGSDISKHFHRIGSFASHPYRTLSLSLSAAQLPPMPDHSEWNTTQSGWTKYVYEEGGASFSEPVPYPIHDGQIEDAIVFDVETMPKEGHPYPVIAIAASPNAWYAWISPWLLGQSCSPAHLIPLGDPDKERLVVGHNVSFDRARVEEEYTFGGTKIRWADTMSLHVAVNGISSHQRPAWNKHKKGKQRERIERNEAVEVVRELVERVLEEEARLTEELEERGVGNERDEEKLSKLKKLRMNMEESLRLSPSSGPSDALDWDVDNENGNGNGAAKRWEDLTSANSLVDVARLHCKIDLEEEKLATRNRLVRMTRRELLPHLFPSSSSSSMPTSSIFLTSPADQGGQENIAEDLNSDEEDTLSETLMTETTEPPLTLSDLLTYCSTDVLITHSVFQVVLPSFLKRCPHPVSFAGALTMGSSFLPVNENWEKYIENAERVYRSMEESVRRRLRELAEEAKDLAKAGVNDDGNEPVWDEVGLRKWERDPWLSQLDWTPKKAGKSRGVDTTLPQVELVPKTEEEGPHEEHNTQEIPGEQSAAWFTALLASPLSPTSLSRILPLLLKLNYNGSPLRWSTKEGWHYVSAFQSTVIGRLPTSRGHKTSQILSARHAKVLLASGEMGASNWELAVLLSSSGGKDNVEERIVNLAKDVLKEAKEKPEAAHTDPWLSQLDWASSSPSSSATSTRKSAKKSSQTKRKPPAVYWPKWYWDITRPKKGCTLGSIDLSPRNRIAPLLLRLAWRGYPLYHSREHGWCYRVASRSSPSLSSASYTTPDAAEEESAEAKAVADVGGKAGKHSLWGNQGASLVFSQPADSALADLALHRGFVFHKLPHKDGEKANVGSPLGKTFIKYAADGTLTSPGGEAKEALELSAVCSYWMSSRDRIMNQMVVWDGGGAEGRWNLGFEGTKGEKWGMILPQVITMGTVTRRAIEKTWLTASNAKKNRVGSELKAMVRAPPGYAIVGADVDSEELWISSCMGDAQFGMHGATALGWMTLEGTKAAGTDLHSKTAKILGLSRDQAKVFNYSRIYGAGMKHAILLLLQANSGMSVEEAHKLAENLYASTKGKNTHRTDIFERKFWFGGSESFVFNKLEEIANSEQPKTPALGCGVTYALSREYLPNQFGSDYMTSRINWVVQSSGVDYLHMLIVSMDYLIARYGIQARYLISVHDELRYLAAEEDKYRVALALQIANLWTRAMFAYKLGMDDLPQGVAFFSAVDVDTCLRKEVDMECVTPSQPVPIPPGESLGIEGVLEKTRGSLGPVLPVRGAAEEGDLVGSLERYEEPDCLVHRCKTAAFLRAQATQDFGEVKGLAQQVYGVKFVGGIGGGGGSGGSARKRLDHRKGNNGAKLAPVGNGEGVDWSDVVDELLRDERAHAKVVMG